jgi:hypothetical protein
VDVGVLLTAEFEAAIVERRVDIQALRVETRRLANHGGEVSQALAVTIPAGWLPAVTQGLDQLIYNWEHEAADERASGELSEDGSSADETLERMKFLVSAMRDAWPDSAYTTGTDHLEALWRGLIGARRLQERAIQGMPEHVDPPILGFIANEQLEALTGIVVVLTGLVSQAEGA